MRIAVAALPAGLAALWLAGCTAGGPSDPSPQPVSTPAPPVSTPAPAAPTAVAEPTTTNTLPPPPAPTAPAASTAGSLDASSLPVIEGWRTVARAGGDEEGYLGNGTWVHARDARYAAFDAITIGCADITRDDYPDPVAALEGTYQNSSGAPGVGLALDFAGPADAQRYWQRYRDQVRACTGDQPVRIEVIADDSGLIDRRSYPDGEWLEVGRAGGTRVTLVILSDDDRSITAERAREILARLPG